MQLASKAARQAPHSTENEDFVETEMEDDDDVGDEKSHGGQAGFAPPTFDGHTYEHLTAW